MAQAHDPDWDGVQAHNEALGAVRKAVAAERERCAKIAESFHRWVGSEDLANPFDKAGIAREIRGQ